MYFSGIKPLLVLMVVPINNITLGLGGTMSMEIWQLILQTQTNCFQDGHGVLSLVLEPLTRVLMDVHLQAGNLEI